MARYNDKKLAVIIPTKDRPDDIRALLTSIISQSVRPSQIIIVDSSDAAIDEILASFRGLDITLVHFNPPSLPAQRNAGLRALRSEIEVVAFFDDDIVLEADAIRISLEKLFQDGRTGGVSMNNISHPRSTVSFLERFFMVGSDKVGEMLPSGFQTKICSLTKDEKTKWLLGGATFWRREVFENHRFDEWFYGYAHCEDLDFSYPLSKKYELIALSDARFIHNTKPIKTDSEYSMGKMQVVNRMYFVRKYKEFSILLCYWACLGLFLKNLFLGIFCLKPGYLSRGIGVLSGIISSFSSNGGRVKEQIKR